MYTDIVWMREWRFSKGSLTRWNICTWYIIHSFHFIQFWPIQKMCRHRNCMIPSSPGGRCWNRRLYSMIWNSTPSQRVYNFCSHGVVRLLRLTMLWKRVIWRVSPKLCVLPHLRSLIPHLKNKQLQQFVKNHVDEAEITIEKLEGFLPLPTSPNQNRKMWRAFWRK